MIKTFFKILFVLILILALAAGAGLGLLTIFQYNPDESESVVLTGQASRSPEQGKPVRILTWNIGYGALGDNADFFMDGGKHVYTADEARVRENLDGIRKAMIQEDADIYLLQEIDRDSDRSRHIDEISELSSVFDGGDKSFQTMFANNFKAYFVPFPVPPIGKVDSGIFTASSFRCQRADRIKLPCPFEWPVSTVNLKRCLLVTRIRLSGSSKYLVLINQHLEAFDDGEGKKEQTKQLLSIMKNERDAGNYVVAGGDFNQVFSDVDMDMYPDFEGTWKPGMIEVEEFLPDFRPLMDNSVPTCRSLDKPYTGDDANHQFYMIDGFIVSDNVKVKSVETLDLGFIYSDHNPVTMEFVLK